MTGGGAPRVLTFSVAGEDEFMLSFGPKDGPQLLVLQPLFEEMNRCRALIVAIARHLAAAGIGCWLPDLPGTGESRKALDRTSWSDWQEAVRSATSTIASDTGRTPHLAAFRGGALFDDGGIAERHWHFSPVAGRSLLSDLRRSAIAGGGDRDAPAGYRLSASLADAITMADIATPAKIRTVRLDGDDRPADRRVEGSPVWRRPEPMRDDALALLLAEDIRDWIRD